MRISDWSSDVCSSDLNTILQLEAVEQRDRLARGALRAVELAEACLEQIEKREPEVGAWSYLDGDHVMQQAKALDDHRSEEHTSELQSLMRISYAVFCLKKKNKPK